MAPEVFDGVFRYSTDVFAYGIIMNELLSGGEQYKGEQFYIERQFIDLIRAHHKRPILFIPKNDMELKLLTIAKTCLVTIAEQRPSFDSIVRDLDSILSVYAKQIYDMSSNLWSLLEE